MFYFLFFVVVVVVDAVIEINENKNLGPLSLLKNIYFFYETSRISREETCFGCIMAGHGSRRRQRQKEMKSLN